MAESPLTGSHIPDGIDAPLVAADLAQTVSDVEQYVVTRWTDTASCDAAIPPASRMQGMLRWVDTVGYWEGVREDAGAWTRLAPDDLFDGSEEAIVGDPPPTGTPKIRQEFTDIIQVSNAQGGFVGDYPDPFPNGITSLTLTAGDTNSSLASVVPVVNNLNLSQYNGVAHTVSGVVANSAFIRVNVVAVGW